LLSIYFAENNKKEIEGKFYKLKSLYLNFLKVKEQVEYKNFIAIGVGEDYDDVECNLENLEMVLRRLSLKEKRKLEKNCQLTIIDFFPQQS
jgi:hypothetical protein